MRYAPNDGFSPLLRGERLALRAAVRGDGHDVRRAVGSHRRAAELDLHHVARKVARVVRHVLVRRRYLAARRVIVCAECAATQRPRAASRAAACSIRRDDCDRLRRLDHQLHLERIGRETAGLLHQLEEARERRDLFGHGDLR